ncbi:MAG: TIGR03751 family conjugal transfer lipoprotein [Gammaproteobacteria bacterium]|nr:TIGR03751 family conjugal transfer lipoprotein [Gammaproteobacteria bacterium]
MRWTRLTTVLLAAVLAGCASKAPSSALAEGPRMIELYRGTAVGEPAGAAAQSASPASPATGARCRWWLFTWPCEALPVEAEAAGGDARGDAGAYARTAANELELLFPRLPNPDVYIHVVAHLATDERVPVPGYTTAVPLYERVEYALPGELEPALRLLAPDGEPADAEASSSAIGETP